MEGRFRRKLFSVLASPVGHWTHDAGLFALRASLGLTMLVAHGWGKFVGFAEKSAGFPDPIGLGGPLSLALMVFAEVFCSLGLVAGIATRLAALPLVIAMAVAAFVQHGPDPWQQKELAFVYLVGFAAIALAGAGRWSVDHWLVGRQAQGDGGGAP